MQIQINTKDPDQVKPVSTMLFVCNVLDVVLQEAILAYLFLLLVVKLRQHVFLSGARP